MLKRIMDTNRLIQGWHRGCQGRPLDNVTPDDVKGWARHVAKVRKTNAIVTPVVIEFLAGTKNSHELTLARSFLAEFHVADGGDIRAVDWEEARRLAQRVPPDGKPRQLGDCLIKAIAKRLNCEVDTADRRFHR